MWDSAPRDGGYHGPCSSDEELGCVDDGERGPAVGLDATAELVELFVGIDDDGAGAERDVQWIGVASERARVRVDCDPAATQRGDERKLGRVQRQGGTSRAGVGEAGSILG